MPEVIDNATRNILQDIANSLRKMASEQAELVAFMRIIARYYDEESRNRRR